MLAGYTLEWLITPMFVIGSVSVFGWLCDRPVGPTRNFVRCARRETVDITSLMGGFIGGSRVRLFR